jgi:hypothetical protein
MTARLVILAAMATLFGGSATGALAQPVPPSAGIWDSTTAAHALRDESREALVTSLRRITGLEDIAFTPDGRIEAGTRRRPGRGSRIAEDVLRKAIESGDVFVIQEHANSPAVTFGQIEGMTYIHDGTGRRAQVWWVRLDFEDFRAIEASKRVRAAFDPGFVLLHELLHALGHRDDVAPGALGECERILNDARRELHLPLRSHYAATRLAPMDDGPDAHLRFEDAQPGQSPSQVRHLFFRTRPGSRRGRVTALAEQHQARTPS